MNKKLALPIARISDWPVKDQEAWHAACQSGGWFEDEGPLARFAQARLMILEAAYGRWLGFLAQCETERHRVSGCDALNAERIRSFIDMLTASLASRSVATYLADLRFVTHALAPSRSFHSLDRAADYLKKTARPSKNKRERVVPSRDLFSLGFFLMDGAPKSGSRLRQACQFRDGLMISLLAACPIRVSNFASIEIGRHLIEAPSGLRLVFPAPEVKNRRPLDYPLPYKLNEPISQYISLYRPYLLERRGRYWRGDSGQVLWISQHGTVLNRHAIWTHITRRTRERFGRSINPHLFRDAAATSIAIELPDLVGIIQPVLGHSSTLTAEKYYNQASSLEAARKFQSAIETLRDGGRP